MGQMSQSTTS